MTRSASALVLLLAYIPLHIGATPQHEHLSTQLPGIRLSANEFKNICAETFLYARKKRCCKLFCPLKPNIHKFLDALLPLSDLGLRDLGIQNKQ